MRPSLDGYSTPQYGGGLYLPHLDLWLDARGERELSVITHAHGDHTGYHQTIIATPETARLVFHRRGEMGVIEVPYGEEWTHPEGRYTLSLLPAGHVLGAAQVLLTEPNGRRTLYTGDFKLREPIHGPTAPIVPCDVLIMEATFGKPHYHFPSDEREVAKLYSICRQTLTRKATPVVFAYSLGKAQEALHYLLQGGFRVSVHGSIVNLCNIYEELGERFEGDWVPYDRTNLAGRVLLAPTQTRKSKMVENIAKRHTIYLSGWGMDSSAKWQFGVDTVLCLSDHADWPDLVRYVEGAQPQRIYTVHGFSDLADHLRTQGYDALHLETHQMALF